MKFTSLDWAIVVSYLIASVSIGWLGKSYIGNVSHHLVAGRKLGVYIGVATLAATEIGTITFMYNAELGYKYGFSAFAAALISGVVMTIVGRTGFVIGRFRQLKLMTVPEFFEIKYSRGLRLHTEVLVAVGGILNMGGFPQDRRRISHDREWDQRQVPGRGNQNIQAVRPGMEVFKVSAKTREGMKMSIWRCSNTEGPVHAP